MPTLPLLSSVTPELASVQLVSVYLTSRFAVLVQGIPPWTGNALPTSGIRTRRARLGSAARASSSIWRNCSGVSDGGVLLTSDSWLLAPGSMFTACSRARLGFFSSLLFSHGGRSECDDGPRRGRNVPAGEYLDCTEYRHRCASCQWGNGLTRPTLKRRTAGGPPRLCNHSRPRLELRF